jgi:hypothetical protein
MSAQVLRLPKRLELQHYVTMTLRKVDKILARLEEAYGQRREESDPVAR